MIRWIRIKNFQSHLDTEIRFDPGFNVIIGENDSGKTAILRALRWVIFNDLKGDYFRSEWGGETSVEVDVDGHVIKRVKNDRENYYVVDGKKIKGFGSSVPDIVREVLNFDKVNYQDQFENVFLLSYSSAEVTRLFNSAMNLEAIDCFFQGLGSMKSKTQVKLRELKERRGEIVDDIDKLSWVDEAEKIVGRVEKLIGKHDILKKQVDEVERFVSAIRKVSKDIKGFRWVGEAEKIIHKVEKYDVGSIEEEIEELGEYIETILRIEDEINEFEGELKVLERKLHEVSDGKCPLCGAELKGDLV